MTISSLLSRGEGSLQPELVQWDSGTSNIVTNDRIYAILADAMMAGCGMDEDDVIGGYRTKLDSHVNMPVLGQHSFILNDTGQTVEVNLFTPQYKAMTAKLVDGALFYDCHYSGKSYVLVVQNAIHVPSMDNNLIPPFMMREARITVNEKAKIHRQSKGFGSLHHVQFYRFPDTAVSLGNLLILLHSAPNKGRSAGRT